MLDHDYRWLLRVMIAATWRRATVLLALLSVVVLGPVLPAQAAPPPSQPALSIVVNTRTSGATTTYEDWVDAATKLQQTGATGLFQSETWADLQASQGVYTLNKLTSVLDGTRQQEILVNIKVIDTTNKSTPAFLQNVGFESPVMRAEFHNLIDQLAPRLSGQVKYLSVGNEVDVWLSQHPEQWPAYTAFFLDAVSYIHTVMPNVLVGVTGTYDGYVGPDAAHMAALTTAADALIATYYPINGYFVPRAPSVALTELPQLAALAGGKPLVMQEIGYPSASALGSSEQAQAQFINNVFQAWRGLGSQALFVNFVMLHDTTPAVCTQYAQYYGVAGLGANVNNWKAYFCSLGLRRSGGQAKPGWNVFLTQAAAFSAARVSGF